jgi:hypothetical protein
MRSGKNMPGVLPSPTTVRYRYNESNAVIFIYQRSFIRSMAFKMNPALLYS